MQNIEAPFPQFKGDESKKSSMNAMSPPGRGMPMPNMPNIADSLPDLNNMNIYALNMTADQSLLPGMDQILKQKEIEKAQDKMMKNTNSPWFIRPEDVQRYNSFFEHFNKSGSGVLDFEETKQAFMQTQLDDNTLEQIWGLVDTEESGEFDRKMFCMAMHLLYKVKLGEK